MIAIIDYGVGNLFSLQSSFAAVGAQIIVTADFSEIEKADRIVLPGVGAFEDAARKLRTTGLDRVLRAEASKGKPILGVCLGMQLLFEKSYEYGEHAGLGLVPGVVVPIAQSVPAGYKVPHMGWNALHFTRQSALFSAVDEGECVYFVHSYHAVGCGKALLAPTEYGAELTAAVQSGNIYGCQFHPEKSGGVGLRILKAFAEMGADAC